LTPSPGTNSGRELVFSGSLADLAKKKAANAIRTPAPRRGQ